MEQSAEDLLHRLMALPMEERIEVIAEDVTSCKDEFGNISPFALAEALGVPGARHPNSSEWSFVRYAEKKTIEDQVEHYCGDAGGVFGIVESTGKLKGKIGEERLAILSARFDAEGESDQPTFDFLTAEERVLVEEVLAEEDLDANQSNGMNCLAYYRITTASEGTLDFQAYIEDDGDCITLLTPYDERDGRFVDLDNSVTDGW